MRFWETGILSAPPLWIAAAYHGNPTSFDHGQGFAVVCEKGW